MIENKTNLRLIRQDVSGQCAMPVVRRFVRETTDKRNKQFHRSCKNAADE